MSETNGLKRSARAPGKMVLAGEYAVLEGYPALVAAVNRFATVSVDPEGDAAVDALGERTPLMPRSDAADDNNIRVPDDAGAAFALVRAVFDEAHAQGIPVPRGHYMTASESMALDVSGGRKLGVGSSSAVAAALARLLLGTDAAPDAVFALADAAHLRFSSGRGSGIDVAAAVYGGICRYQDRRATPVTIDFGELAPLAVYVGQSQSTRTFLDRVSALKARDANVYASRLAMIAEHAARMEQGLSTADAKYVLDGVRGANLAMAALGRDCGADIVSAPHAAMAALAADHDGAAKPSGAGGGDLSIAFVPTVNASQAKAAITAAGFVLVDLELGAAGAQ